MILSGWAKMIDNAALFRGEIINSVEIGIGRNDAQQRVKFACLTRKTGNMFATETIERYEIHRLHDVFPENDSAIEVRKWLMQNIEQESLHKLIQREKLSLLTMYSRHAKRLVKLTFDNPEHNYETGVSDGVQDDIVKEFFLHNTFTTVDEAPYTCVGVELFDNARVLAIA